MRMAASKSVTIWLEQLKAGAADAAQQLWERYFHRLVALARQRLQARPGMGVDEEDVALSAFDSFFRGVEQQRFPQLADRDDLWRLLVTLTARKVGRSIRQQQSQKRGGGAVQHLSALDDAELASVIGSEPTPDFAAQVAEQCHRLLDHLGNAELQAVAVAKMEGYTNAEIAQRLGVVERTVERRLGLIRKLWSDEDAA